MAFSRPKLCPAPAPAFRYKVKGGRAVVALYERCHLAQSVGIISDWYGPGRRSVDDSTQIWTVDGIEYGAHELERIGAHLTELTRAAGVKDLGWGEQWCGYRGVWVRFADDTLVETRWDAAAGRVLELVNGAPAPALVAVAS